MPEIIDDSEIYLSSEIKINNGPPDEVVEQVHTQIDNTKRFLEAYRGLMGKLERDAAEQQRRKGVPVTPKTPIPPNKTVTSVPPTETKPPSTDSPALQGARDLDVPREKVVVLDSKPQTSEPLVSSREPTHSAYDQLNPVSLDDIINLLASPPPDFEAFRRRLETNSPEEGERHPTHATPASRKPAKAGDPVDLFSGAFTLSATDLSVPTPFLPIAMSRSYRSGRPYFGPFGYGWDHVYNVNLRPLKDGGMALWSGQLHEEYFAATGGGFEPRPGFAARLERLPGPAESYALEFAGGNRWLFERPSGWSDPQRIPLVAIRDRHGNSVNLTYGLLDQLRSVLDDAGRGLLFEYGTCHLLEVVTDHLGERAVHYHHDMEIEHLVRVIYPPTAQYPTGFSTKYEYSSYAPHPAMRHNIVRVLDEADRRQVENDFGGPDSGWEFNCVVRQRIGGFEYEFGYEQIQYVDPDQNHVDVLAARTLVRSPDGALHTYTFNYRGDLLDHRFRLSTDGSFRVVAYQWEHDAEGNVTLTTGPDGLRTISTYDSANPNPCARRNLMQVQLGAPMSEIVPSRIVFEGQYDPRFQLPIFSRDEAGAETRFVYDFDVVPLGASGRLRQLKLPSVVGADGVPQQSILTFEHNARGQIKVMTSAEGCRTEFEYLAGGITDGFPSTTIKDPSGAHLVATLLYDAAGFPQSIEAPGGRLSGFVHNALGQLEQTTAPVLAGQDARFRRWFDDSGAVIRVERPSGSYVGLLAGSGIIDEFERDAAGNVVRAVLASNTNERRESLYLVDHEGRTVAHWDASGVRGERVYGENGAVLSESRAAGESEIQVTRYFHDHAGRVNRAVDANGAETLIEYDVWGRTFKVTLPKGGRWTIESGVNDRLLEERIEEVESGGVLAVRQRQTYEYDRRGRVTFTTRFSFRDTIASAVPLTVRYLYDRDDRPLEMLLPRGGTHLYEYDTCGRPTKVTDLLGNIQRFVYGPTGELAKIEAMQVEGGVTKARTQEFDYDDRGRLAKSTCLDGFLEYRFDDRNLPIHRRQENGVVTECSFNAHGRCSDETVDPPGLALRSQFEYDVNGQLQRYVDPMGESTTWVRNKLGRAISLTTPDGAIWQYSFDVAARTATQQTPAGNRIVQQQLDPAGRVVRITASPAPGQTSVPPRELAFDGLGRLIRASSGGASIVRRYDGMGRVIEEMAQGRTVRTEYDDVAGTRDLVYPDGRRERTETNPAGQPTRVLLVTPGGLGGVAGTVLLQIEYSTAGRPVGTTYANGVEATFVHDDANRLIRIEYQHAGVLLDSCRLRYDGNGHRAVVQHLGAPARNLLHTFDPAGRLVEARHSFVLPPLADVAAPAVAVNEVVAAQTAAAGALGIQYVLDAADTRVKTVAVNGGAAGEVYSTGKDHRPIAVGADAISYNLDAQRKQDARHDYELDALNRVTRIRDRATNAVIAELEYDALSRVAAGSNNGEVFQRWFSGETQVHEDLGAVGAARQHTAHPLWAAPLCISDNDGAAFVHQDEGLSTMIVTDAAGTAIERHRYEPFGGPAIFAGDGVTPLPAPRTPPSWRGMPAIGTTRIFRTPHRLYDSDVGVFLSRDPLLYADSASPYAYAAHNPVDFADPTGLAKDALGKKPTGPQFYQSYDRSHQTLQPLSPDAAREDKMDKLLTYDLPPEESGHRGEDYFVYAFIYGLKQSIYKPIKAHILDERPTYLDSAHNVRRVPWKPDRMDAAAAYAQILMIPMTSERFVFGIRRPPPIGESPFGAVGGGPRLPAPPENPFANLTDAELDAFAPDWDAVTAPDYYHVPIAATEAGAPVENMVPVSRWGRTGLQPNDWVVPGAPSNYGTYMRSFKWDPLGKLFGPKVFGIPLNEFAPRAIGEGFMVPPESVTWPTGKGLDGAFKGLFSQRKYTPNY